MPKAVRKSLSRCSSRSSGTSTCRKRGSPRDNILSSIREAVRSSSTASRPSGFKYESPSLQELSMISRIRKNVQPETKPENFKPETDTPKGSIKEAVAGDKPIGLIEHGIRYVMLPLHLFHLCIQGSSAAASSKTKENQSSSPKLRENKNKSSIPSSAKNIPRRTLAPSPTSSTSGFSSCSSNLSKTSGVAPIVDLPTYSSAPLNVSKIEKSSASSSTFSATSGSLPVEESSLKNGPAPVLKPIFQDIVTDKSSDEMVTADECFDDSSNDRWSSAESSPSMNMSIDFDGWIGPFEKISANPTHEDCSAEEPMEVSMEESSLNPTKWIVNRSPYRGFRFDSSRSKVERGSYRMSSSSGSEEPGSSCREDISDSSADREIAGILQRASTSPSSSSDDEERDRLSGRRNNPFAKDVELERSRHREELCNATLRKKRTALAYHDPPKNFHERRVDRRTAEDPRSADCLLNSSRTKEASKETNAKLFTVDSTRIPDQTDSAYSDEDVEMNIIDSMNHLQSFAMQSLQESVIEWMDQDLDYVADTEDSNDGSPLAGSSKVSSDGSNPRSRFDELDGLPVGGKPASPEVEGRFGCNGSTAIRRATSRPMAAPEVGEIIDRSKKIPRPMASPRVGRRSDQWRTNFRLGESGPRRTTESVQNSSATKCHCGNPKCLFVPVALPIDVSSTATWAIEDYPRATSPLGRANSLYREYPEFIIPIADTMGDKKMPYVLVPANFVLP